MRDIKFRIYFKDEEGTLSLPLKDFRFFYAKNENYEIMQYTGLHDRNRKRNI